MFPALLPEDAFITGELHNQPVCSRRTQSQMAASEVAVLVARLMSAMFGPNHLALSRPITGRMLQTACLCISVEKVATNTNKRPSAFAHPCRKRLETDPQSDGETDL